MCWRCHRPRRVCWCGDLRPVQSQTRVVFVQHPREAKVGVSTSRMAHLSLPNSEFHVAVGAAGNARLEALGHEPDVALLFPSPGATDVDALERPLRTLVVVDGTWSNAKKMVERCPVLSRLPRIAFRPERPGNYRIRREPAAHCVSTIEAVAQVLDRLERAPGRFSEVLGAFDAMVDRQLAFIGSDARRSRHKRTRRRNSTPVDPLSELRQHGQRLVAVFGEANAWPLDRADRPAGDTGELIQLVARRLATGDAFSSLLAPARPLGPTVAYHLGLEAAQLASAPAREAVRGAWRAFLRPDDVLVGWGPFCRGLLEDEALAPAHFIDARAALAHRLGRRPGAVEDWAERLGAVAPSGVGRASRRLAALVTLLGALLDGAVELPRLEARGPAGGGEHE